MFYFCLPTSSRPFVFQFVLIIYFILSFEFTFCHQNASAALSTTNSFVSGSDQQHEEIVMAIIVEAGKFDCLYQTVAASKYQSFEVDYRVVEGGDLDITFSMKSPKGFMIANDQRKPDGFYRIALDEPQHGRGDYALCFDNTFSYTSSKRVVFEIFLLDKNGNYLNNDFDLKTIQRKDDLLKEHLEVFNRVTKKVKGYLNEIERIQAQFRAIETRDRSIMETAFERVNFWSVVHLVCLFFAAGVQVFMLRSFFLADCESLFGRFVGGFK